MTYAYRPNRLERLVDAEPCFYEATGREGVKLGLIFACPIHADHCYVGVQFANPSDGGAPQEPRLPAWRWNGAVDFDELSVEPSIKNLGPDCHWHGFIRNGRFETCDDSR